MFRDSGGVGRQESPNGDIVTYHPWQRNATLVPVAARARRSYPGGTRVRTLDESAISEQVTLKVFIVTSKGVWWLPDFNSRNMLTRTKKYSSENPHSTGVQKNQKQPCIFRARAGTKALRFRNLAPCRISGSRARHSIVFENEKTDHSRGSEVTRPKFEGQQLPPA
jgi:hypothetical protein